MTRSDLEHVIRAAGSIAKDSEIVVIGSQSVLGQFPNAPVALLASAEADMYPLNHPERAELIDRSIGEGSRFHETHGYYAQAVSEETATLPAGWRRRLVRVNNTNTDGVSGLCLEVHDLAISKYYAGREKDFEFTAELAKHGLTDKSTLLARLKETALTKPERTLIEARIKRDFTGRAARSVKSQS
jgi:hypothetical protein